MEKRYKGLFASDMDGTLLQNDGEFDERDLKALSLLGEMGYLRVIATGRSPFSFHRMMRGRKLPLDYLVLSNGAGIQNCRTGEYSSGECLNQQEVREIQNALVETKVDFCIQDVFPENHRFVYHRNSVNNPDMDERIALYSRFCREITSNEDLSPSTQAVAMIPPEETEGKIEEVKKKLGSSFSVIRTTSPLDGKSLWIEIFAKGVSKSSGTSLLTNKYRISRSNTAAIGNDYNDIDLLEWVNTAYVVPHSPPSMLSLFQSVSYNGGTGVTEAVKDWLTSRGETIPEGYSL